MNILFVESDSLQEYNCSYWRVMVPLIALRKAGHTVEKVRVESWGERTPEAVKLTERADLVIVQRNLMDRVVLSAFHWTQNGKAITVDLDDAYEFMTEDTGSPTFKTWKHGVFTDSSGKEQHLYPTPMMWLKWGVKLLGTMTSPSKLICQDWSEYARAFWFPNYADTSIYHPSQVYKEPGKVYIGWGGSATHLASWEKSGVLPALQRIIKEYPNVVLMLMGDERVERFLKEIPKHNRAVLGFMPHAEFVMRLNTLDIGLVPLYGEYDRRRSWIKAMEYSLMGVPWIGTAFEPTADVETGLRIANTTDGWYMALKFYIDNLVALKQAAVENVPAAQERFGIQNHVSELLATFEQIAQTGRVEWH